MSLKVIGTGFVRTGTDSMGVALDILSFGPCHHMRELIEDQKYERLLRSVVAVASADRDLLLVAIGVGFPGGTSAPDVEYCRKLVDEFRKNIFAAHTFFYWNQRDI